MNRNFPGGECEKKGIPVGKISLQQEIKQIMTLFLDMALRSPQPVSHWFCPLRSFCPSARELLAAALLLWVDFKSVDWDFPAGPVVKNPPANAATRVQSLVWEEPTCLGATKPRSHNC